MAAITHREPTVSNAMPAYDSLDYKNISLYIHLPDLYDGETEPLNIFSFRSLLYHTFLLEPKLTGRRWVQFILTGPSSLEQLTSEPKSFANSNSVWMTMCNSEHEDWTQPAFQPEPNTKIMAAPEPKPESMAASEPYPEPTSVSVSNSEPMHPPESKSMLGSAGPILFPYSCISPCRDPREILCPSSSSKTYLRLYPRLCLSTCLNS